VGKDLPGKCLKTKLYRNSKRSHLPASTLLNLKSTILHLKILPPGEYRLVLKYGGKGGSATIAIDELKTSSPFKYNGGCNAAPVAIRDNITGMANRTASGTLVDNDKEQNSEAVSA
jgi:hypothetical protein